LYHRTHIHHSIKLCLPQHACVLSDKRSVVNRSSTTSKVHSTISVSLNIVFIENKQFYMDKKVRIWRGIFRYPEAALYLDGKIRKGCNIDLTDCLTEIVECTLEVVELLLTTDHLQEVKKYVTW
jgi:hypothetical protein